MQDVFLRMAGNGCYQENDKQMSEQKLMRIKSSDESNVRLQKGAKRKNVSFEHSVWWLMDLYQRYVNKNEASNYILHVRIWPKVKAHFDRQVL